MLQHVFNTLVHQHQEWLNNPKKGKQAKFKRTSLSDVFLSNVNLSGALFFEVDLTSTMMTNMDLSNAYFYRSKLEFATLSNSNLDDCYFYTCDLSNAYLTNTIITKPNFLCCNLANINLLKTNLKIYHSGLWAAFIGPLYTRIGCKIYSNEQWKHFSDQEIYLLANDALPYWNKNKKIIFELMESFEDIGTN